MAWIARNRKFLVAVAGALVPVVATLIHRPIDEATTQTIVGGIAAALVWIVPNVRPS